MFDLYLIRILEGVCVVLLLLVARAIVFAVQCLTTRRAYVRSEVPGPPPAKSLLGHLHYFKDNRGPWELAKLAAEYGPLFKLQMLHELRYFVTDPEVIARISKRSGPGPYLPKPRETYWPMELMTKPHLPNILTAEDGPYWKVVRQATAPCFSIINLKQVLPTIVKLTKRAADRMSETVSAAAVAGVVNSDESSTAPAAAAAAVSFDVSDAAKRITSDVMGYLLLGEDLEGTQWKQSEYLSVINKMLVALDHLFENPVYLWQRFWDSAVADQYRALQHHDQIMTEKVMKIMRSSPPEYTVAAHLLSVKDPATGKPLSLNQIKAEMSIFMGAGFETTSHAISWTLAMLSLHPEIQESLYSELSSAELTHRDITAADLSHLSLMSAVIKEVLRLLPPNPWGGTKVTVDKETDLLGFKLPKGSYINTPLLPVAVLERNFGKDALLFKPERWLLVEPGVTAAAAAPAPAGDSAHCLASASSSSSSGCMNSSSENKDAVTAASPAVPPSSESPAVPPSSGSPGVPHTCESPAVPPDPLTFMVGPRDCLGQSLAKMELQLVLAVLLSRFRFYPGPKLQQEMKVVEGLGEPPVAALYAVTDVHVTMQPAGGEMVLYIESRA